MTWNTSARYAYSPRAVFSSQGVNIRAGIAFHPRQSMWSRSRPFAGKKPPWRAAGLGRTKNTPDASDRFRDSCLPTPLLQLSGPQTRRRPATGPCAIPLLSRQLLAGSARAEMSSALLLKYAQYLASAAPIGGDPGYAGSRPVISRRACTQIMHHDVL